MVYGLGVGYSVWGRGFGVGFREGGVKVVRGTFRFINMKGFCFVNLFLVVIEFVYSIFVIFGFWKEDETK